MNPRPIEQAKTPDLANSMTALRRAALRAQRMESFTAEVQTGFESGDREKWVGHEEPKAKLLARIARYKRQATKA